MQVAKQKKFAKRAAKRKARKELRQGHRQMFSYSNRGTYNSVNLPRFYPDRIQETFAYTEIPTNRFNTSATVGSIAYNMNSMLTLFNGGSAAVIPYFNAFSDVYNKYRVLRSKIIVQCQSRESTNGMEILVVPMSGVSFAINTAAEYANCASLKWAQRKMLSPVGSGPNIVKLTAQVDCSKFIGPEYLTNPDYAGTPGVSDPATMFYWVVGYYNPNLNTVTTGGVLAQVTLVQTIELYDPERTDSVTLIQDPDNPNAQLSRSKQITKQIEQLTRELSSLSC